MTEKEIADGDGRYVRQFIDAFGTITKDSVAGAMGEPLWLRPWQGDLVDRLYARRTDGRLKHRRALIGFPRKNGKSSIVSCLGLYHLVACQNGAEVYCAAAEKEQARILFSGARKMVEADQELSGIIRVFKDVLEVPSTGSILRCLSAEAYSKEGLNPTAVLFDEVHAQPNDELWNVMALASGARIDPILIGITTAGVRIDVSGNDSLCYRLYQHGVKVALGEIEDDAFYLEWHSAPADSDHKDPKVWAEANPGYDDLIDPEDFAASLTTTPEAEFRTKRLNLWVSSAQVWLPHGAWDACADTIRLVPPKAPIVLGFDGSLNDDSTALVGCTLPADGPLHVFVIDAWERDTDDPYWKVPVADVLEAIQIAIDKYDVQELVCDTFLWQSTLVQMHDERKWPVVEIPNSTARKIDQEKRFRTAVIEHTLTQDGDLRLARHIGNAGVRRSREGDGQIITKRHSSGKIDLAVAATLAYFRAVQAVKKPKYSWSIY